MKAVLSRLLSRPDPAVQRLHAFSRKKWRPSSGRDRVVLASLYDIPISVAIVAFAGNVLAEEMGARLGAFCFEENPDPALAALYRGLGAPLLLQAGRCAKTVERAEKAAEELLERARTKEALIEAMYDGMLVGDLIYDSYLRQEAKPTVDFADPKLKEITGKVFESLFLCERFFAENDVAAVIPDHVVYLRGGAISRYAARHGVPVLLPVFREKFSFRAAEWIDAGAGRQALYNFDFEHFPEFFAGLDLAEQESGRQIARDQLEHILNGRTSPVEGMNSPYAAPSADRVLPDTGRPRALIMMHEFCDAPHCLGHMLYADFWEWIHDTLRVAAETDFDWFIKPHACLLMKGRRAINEANRQVLDELHRIYPKVTILPPDISNRQILQDGISSMFTLHGSAGYEFTYLGVPVVTAGNTHYRRYGFTHNPESVEEYRDWIRHADQVPAKADQKKIEEFYYALLAHTRVGRGEGAPLFPAEVFQSEFDKALLSKPAVYDLVREGFTPTVESGLRTYLREFAQSLSLR